MLRVEKLLLTKLHVKRLPYTDISIWHKFYTTQNLWPLLMVLVTIHPRGKKKEMGRRSKFHCCYFNSVSLKFFLRD
jgi:hypothetical protein